MKQVLTATINRRLVAINRTAGALSVPKALYHQRRARRHGGLEILAIRYLWNKANSFVFFLRELIKGQGPGCIAP